jgi:uncharacterized membrane protein YfcA
MPTAPDAPWIFPLLFMTGLAAGWVNAITGGGGLVVLPVFLAVDVPPYLALGTNMLQSSVGTLAAADAFMSHRQVNLREVALGIVCTVVGAVGGVVAVQHLAPTALKDVLPLALAGIGNFIRLAFGLSYLLKFPYADTATLSFTASPPAKRWQWSRVRWWKCPSSSGSSMSRSSWGGSCIPATREGRRARLLRPLDGHIDVDPFP